jgi:hypothetical protein
MKTITIQFGDALGNVDVAMSEELLQSSQEEIMAALQDAVMTLQHQMLSLDVNEADS